jgi:predicted ATPase/class 3 adenylate cyclase
MFCDLVGSTDLSGKLDPEDLRDVVRAYQKMAAEVIQRYEGHIAQYLGDGLLIYFGYPVAHEDDAQRAVYTGLGIPEAIVTLNTQLKADYGVQLAVRIGIHTGPVVVGEMGGGGRHENLALGETPNIAARLEGLAPPNTVVMSAVTAHLVERTFILEELGPHALKGVVEPMMLYTVVTPREVDRDDHEAMMAGGFEALVGRDEEIGLLLRRWEQSKDGFGQVVLIRGEAGIGKSSLVEGLRGHVRAEGRTRLAFRCSPYHTTSALYPIIEHVQRSLDWQPEDTAGTRLAKLEQGLENTSLALEEAVPLLASLFSLPVPEARYPALSLSPQQQRQYTQDVLVAWVLEKAERQPVLAVWEDLHWADPSTVEALGLVMDQTPTVAMLHVLTFRPEFVPPWPARSHMTPLTLNRLERLQVESLITRLAGGKALPAEVVQHIVAKTDGVPLFVEELTKMLLNSAVLGEANDHYELTGPLLSVAIPDTLHDSLMARLDQLNSAKEIAQLGAVLGREFSYEMLQAIAPHDHETLQAGLVQLVEAELLYQRGRPPRAHYVFKHALIQDAAYASLLRSTRQQIHRRVALVLEARFPDRLEAYYGLLAHHYGAAEDLDKALSYHSRAAGAAQRVYAVEEALEHYTHALDIAVAGESGAEAVLVSDLHIQRGRVYAQTGTIERAQADFEAALRAARTAGNQASEMQALYALGSYGWATDYQKAIPLFEAALPLAQALDDTASQVRILSRMSIVYTNRLQLAQAFVHGQQALDLARALGDEHTLALAMDSLAVAAAFMGDFTTLEEIGPQLTAIHRRHGDLWYLQFALYQWCYVPIGQGRWDDAITQLEEALAINRRIGDRGNEPIYTSTLCWVHGSRGAYAHAFENGRLAVSRSEELGHTELLGWNAGCLGWALLEVYALEEAAQLLERGREAAEGTMALNLVLRCIGPLAWASWLLGDTERAQTLAVQAEALCQQLTVPPGRAFLQGIHAYVAIAWVHLARGEAERARQLLTPVLAAAETCGWQEAIAYGSLIVGQSLLASGAGDQAEQALQRALQVTHDVSLPGVAWKTHAALGAYYRGCQQIDTAARHQAQAHTVIEQLATTLDDAAMRQGFLHAARSQLGEGL